MRRLALVFGVVLTLAACGGGDDPTVPPGETGNGTATQTPEETGSPDGAVAGEEVVVTDNSFAPHDLTVAAGATVTFRHVGENPHTVTADDGSFDSHPDCAQGQFCMENGEAFEVVVDEEIAYHCKVHGGPGGLRMSGTIAVG